MPVKGKQNLSNLKAIIFDYGDVLCLPPAAFDIEGSARVLGISSDSFRDLWRRNRDQYDRGDLSPEIYWQKFAEDAGARLTPAQLHELSDRDVAMWSRSNPQMLAWLTDLSSAGMKTAVLSNMHIGMVQYARQNFEWLKRVHCATLSAEVGLIKPDPAIYELCLRCLGVAPFESLFIDDLELNIAAARTMGINALHFQSVGQLRSELEQAGFPNLPSDTRLERTRSA